MIKKTFLLFLITFYLNQVNGQNDLSNLKVKTIENYNLFYKLNKPEVDSIYFNLKKLKTSPNNQHIRISIPGQIIDIFKNSTYHGTITNEITEYDYQKGKEKTATIYKKVFEEIPLDERKIQSVFNKLIDSKQYEIATDSLIPNWNSRFLHCSSLTFEYKLNNQLYYQDYYCPWAQNDSIEFKKVIIENFENIKSTFQLDSLYDDFETRLPKGKTYSKDGYRTMYIMTTEQSEGWKRGESMRNHLKSVKDSIDNYITAELKKQNIKLRDIDCFENYNLSFNSNGKLVKIDVSEYDKPKLKESLNLWYYLKDKKEVRKCKRTIKKLFKNINLSKFEPKYQFDRNISFNHKGEFHLYDNTIY